MIKLSYACGIYNTTVIKRNTLHGAVVVVGHTLRHDSTHGSCFLVSGISSPVVPSCNQQSFVASLVPSIPHDSLHEPYSPQDPHSGHGQEITHVSVHATPFLVPTISSPVVPSFIQQSFTASLVPSAPHDTLHGPYSPQGPHSGTGQGTRHLSVHGTFFLLLGIS